MTSVISDSARLLDLNAVASWLLRDLASVQSSRQKQFGFKRAAAVLFRLEVPVQEIWSPAGLVPRIIGVAPASGRNNTFFI